jgi:hypothetical protein
LPQTRLPLLALIRARSKFDLQFANVHLRNHDFDVDRLAGTYTDPNTGAVVDHYSTKRFVTQPVQHVEYVAQENISYVQQMVPEVTSFRLPTNQKNISH